LTQPNILPVPRLLSAYVAYGSKPESLVSGRTSALASCGQHHARMDRVGTWVIVATKPANKAEQPAAEQSAVERVVAEPVGAKGRDRGECAPTKHAPDAEPGKRDTGRWLVYGSELPSIPEESRTYGSVRGARGDSRPYREAGQLFPVLAHRVDSLRCEGSDAIGAKRTCRERRERVDLPKMTPS
jgi:hypothetical protein